MCCFYHCFLFVTPVTFEISFAIRFGQRSSSIKVCFVWIHYDLEVAYYYFEIIGSLSLHRYTVITFQTLIELGTEHW